MWPSPLPVCSLLRAFLSIIGSRHKRTPDVPGPLKDIFRDTPTPMRAFIVGLVLALGGMSVQVWRLSEQTTHANERSAATVQQLQNYYLEAEQYRRAVAGALTASQRISLLSNPKIVSTSPPRRRTLTACPFPIAYCRTTNCLKFANSHRFSIATISDTCRDRAFPRYR